MKKFKLISVFCILILLMSIFLPVLALAEESSGDTAKDSTEDTTEDVTENTAEDWGPETDSKCIVLLDADSGSVLFSKAADEKAYPASLTKVMTVLLAVEAIERGEKSADDVVTCAGNIAFDLIEDGSTSGIVSGETMTLKNLMYCAMVASANEACNAIAAYISGNIQDFITLMNERASELGCTGTNFANTHGLPNTNHYSTAGDFAKIVYEAYQHPLFMEICNTIKVTIPATNMSPERQLSNTNGLINPDSELYPGYYYKYAVGIKTGHTDAAGYCLVSSAKQGDVSLICVIMGGYALDLASGTQYSNFTDSINLYDWAFETYSYQDVLKTTDLVSEIPVVHGKDASFVTLCPKEVVSVLLPAGDTRESLEQVITLNEDEIEAPVEAGTVLGTVQIVQNGRVCGQTQLVASSSIELSVGSKVSEFLTKPLVLAVIIIFAVLLLAYIILLARYNSSRKKYKAALQSKKALEERRRQTSASQRTRTGDDDFRDFFGKK
jgi:D-alanyl-D-alanine carboxypeptidase (penicillin-binding protein 5/6)